mgnify:CR=1 FL=1
MKNPFKYNRLSTWFFGIYLLLSPLDMALNIFNSGTILKYIGILTIFICVLELIKNRVSIKLDRLQILIIFLFVYYLASVLWSDSEPRIGNAISIINLALFYCIMTMRGYTENEYKFIRFFCLVGALIYSIYMIVNAKNLLLYERVTMGFGGELIDPNDMAASLILPFFLGIQIIRQNSRNIFGKFAVVNVLIIGFAILLTVSRGALLSLIIGLIALVLFSSSVSMQKKCIGIVFSILICIMLYQLVEGYLPNTVKSRITLSQVLEDRASDRFTIWKNAFHLFSNSSVFRMLFGYGIANFPVLHLKIYGSYVTTHNIFIQSLLEGGFIGLILIMSIFTEAVRKTLSKHKWVMFGILIATIIVSCSIETINKKFLWNALIFASINIVSKSKIEESISQ